jgi:hypothetical protein
MTVEQFFQEYPSARGVWQVGEELYLSSAKAKAEARSRETGKPVSWITPESLKPAKPAKEKPVSDASE